MSFVKWTFQVELEELSPLEHGVRVEVKTVLGGCKLQLVTDVLLHDVASDVEENSTFGRIGVGPEGVDFKKSVRTTSQQLGDWRRLFEDGIGSQRDVGRVIRVEILAGDILK